MDSSRQCSGSLGATGVLKRLVSVALLATSMGCSLLVTAPPEEQVRKLSEEWLAALMRGDYKKAYEYTTPGYQATHSARDHGRSYAGAGMWRKYEISRVDCGSAEHSSRCVAILMVTYKALRGGFENTRPLELVWIKSESRGWGLYTE